jgi:branched-chain amino acid transport system permease protein
VLQQQILYKLANYLSQLSARGILNIPSQADPAEYQRLIFGLILILMCIYRSQGILPAKRRLASWWEQVRQGQTKKQTEESADAAGS